MDKPAKISDEKPLEDKVVTLCMNRFIRPTRIYNMVPEDAISPDTPEGHGNCEVCTYDGNNGYCAGYTPIKLFTFYVHEANN